MADDLDGSFVLDLKEGDGGGGSSSALLRGPPPPPQEHHPSSGPKGVTAATVDVEDGSVNSKDDDDDVRSEKSGSGSGSSGQGNSNMARGRANAIGQREDKLVTRSKMVVAFVLLLATAAVSTLTYRYTKNEEDQDFAVRVSSILALVSCGLKRFPPFLLFGYCGNHLVSMSTSFVSFSTSANDDFLLPFNIFLMIGC